MNYFIFKNIDSRDIKGLIVQELPPISKPAKRIEKIEIDGKDGDIIQESGYQAYDKTISIGLTNNYDINQIIAWLDGSGNLVLSNEPEKYYNAIVIEQIDFERLMRFKTAKIKFHVQPFKYKANEEFSLVKDRKDKQASGEYIHVEDSSNCRCRIGIGGNQEQETRSGKNLLELMEGTYSDQGITAVVKNGIVTLNGAATGISFVGINLLKNFNLITENAYRLSAFNTEVVGNSSDNLCSLRLNGEGTKETTLNKTNSNKAITGNFLLTYITIRTAQGITYNNFVIKPQLELGNGTDTWEQGGVSPSPDYQSPVKTVGSNVQVFDKNNVNKLNAFINGETKVISSWENCKTLYIPCLKNKYYTVTKKGTRFIVGTTTNVPSINTNCNQISADNTAKSITIKTLDIDKYLVVFYYNSGSDTLTEQEILDSIKIVEGTEVGEYSKYGQGCAKVTICNKNLFDKNTTIDGEYIGSNGSIQTQNNIMHSDYIQIKTNINYYITGRSEWSSVALYDKNKTFLERISTTQPNGVLNITNSNCKYIIINALITDKDTLQLEEGISTSYEEHKEQSYIMPVQQEMLEDDYFDWDNEEEVHTWGKYEFTGEEAFSIAFNSNYYVIYTQGDFINNFDYNETVETYKCSHFKSIAVNTRYQNNTFFINTTRNLTFTTLKYSTVTDFKTWLKSLYDAGTPVVVYYKLAMPTRLQFTEEQKALAKELNNARTYKNVTNITTDSIAKLSLDYFTVTDETINNEGNIQSRPILRLEKTVSEAVELTINDIRFKYNFNNDEYVEIDCEEKTVEYEGLNRNRSIEIGYDFPKLKIGNNDIKIHDGDCKIKILRKDRWL